MESGIIVIAGLIINDENKIFLAHRSTNKHLAGYWEFPGGKVENDEEEKDCLKRELYEELGISVLVKAEALNERKIIC